MPNKTFKRKNSKSKKTRRSKNVKRKTNRKNVSKMSGSGGPVGLNSTKSLVPYKDIYEKIKKNVETITSNNITPELAISCLIDYQTYFYNAEKMKDKNSNYLYIPEEVYKGKILPKIKKVIPDAEDFKNYFNGSNKLMRKPIKKIPTNFVLLFIYYINMMLFLLMHVYMNMDDKNNDIRPLVNYPAIFVTIKNYNEDILADYEEYKEDNTYEKCRDIIRELNPRFENFNMAVNNSKIYPSTSAKNIRYSTMPNNMPNNITKQ